MCRSASTQSAPLTQSGFPGTPPSVRSAALDTPRGHGCAPGSVPARPLRAARMCPGLDVPLWGAPGGRALEIQVCLTLAVPARVARGAVALAGADIEMSIVPAAHATRVPGDFWSDEEAALRGASLRQARQVPPRALRAGLPDSPSVPPNSRITRSGSRVPAAPAGGRQGWHLPQRPPAWSQALKQPETRAVQSEHQSPFL